ncbi:anti-CBASS protein Acb1 family protein [Xenorhabdus stockiae]|uniref:anti-CBASS protein Acb1 family protein n=1 Tax=Xenorhabdus stockiae TaxID=351614 RepID=UPI003CF5012A
MKISENGLSFIKQYEGLKLKAYPDPATGGIPWTIGYGHTKDVKPGQVITEQQAEAFLHDDLKSIYITLESAVKVSLTQGQFDALCSFIFNCGAGNRNLMLLDKNQEEFFQFNTPLSGLDALQRQAQEQMAAPSHTPLVKLLGITPSGLNASSDGEIRVYADYIASLQSAHLLPQMTIILKLLQLHLFGAIDEGLYFEFNSLHQLTDEQRAATEKSKAEMVQIYHQSGVIDGEEARQYVAADEDNPLRFIDPKKIIPPPFGVPDYGNQDDTETDNARS